MITYRIRLTTTVEGHEPGRVTIGLKNFERRQNALWTIDELAHSWFMEGKPEGLTCEFKEHFDELSMKKAVSVYMRDGILNMDSHGITRYWDVVRYDTVAKCVV